MKSIISYAFLLLPTLAHAEPSLFCATQARSMAASLAELNGNAATEVYKVTTPDGKNFKVTLVGGESVDNYAVSTDGGHDCFVTAVVGPKSAAMNP